MFLLRGNLVFTLNVHGDVLKNCVGNYSHVLRLRLSLVVTLTVSLSQFFRENSSNSFPNKFRVCRRL